MISKENEHLISQYDDPDLSATEREQLTDLLETDDSARGLEAQYRRLDAELERLPDGLDSVDFTGFRERIRESIEAAPVIRMSQRRLWTRWAPIAAAASVAIAFVSIWQALKTDPKISLQTPIGPSFTNSVQIESPEVKPTGLVVNRIQLAVAPAAVVEASFAMDLEVDSVYDDGGVICFIGTESESNGTSRSSGGSFMGELMKGST
jgi:hypothetical protein